MGQPADGRSSAGLYSRDASARHPDAGSRRPVLQARRLPYRPGAAGGAGRDHPRPFRPCPARPWRGAGDAGNARHDAAALRRQFRRQHAGDRLWRGTEARRRHGSNFIPPAMCWARRRSRSTCKDTCIVASGDYKDAPDPTCTPFEVVPLRRLHHRGHLRAAGVPSRRCGGRGEEAAGLGGAVSGARASGRRLFAGQGAARDRADPRWPVTTRRSICMARWRTITRYYESRGIALGDLRPVKGMKKADLAGTITLAPPSATSDVWTRRFPDPVTAFASGWMRVRARARQRGVELPLVISDHADWDGLTATIDATGARRNLGHPWPGRRAGALVQDQGPRGAAARSGRLRRRG